MAQWRRFIGTNDLNVDFLCALLAEFIGTFLFVLIGALCTCFKPNETEWPRASPVQVAFALGCAAFSISHSLGPISGAHLSPAVSLGFFLICGMSIICFIGYIIAQCAGGLAATGIILLILDEELYQDRRPLRPLMGVSMKEICIVEGVASFIWVLMTMVTTELRSEDKYGNGSFAVGLTVSASYLIAILITGGGVSPVRSLAAAILVDEWDYHIYYWLGPIGGACFAATLYLCCSGTSRHSRIYYREN